MKIYDWIDDRIMDGVNVGVQAYNWTTGGTKANLSKFLVNISAVNMISGFCLLNPVVGLINSPITFLCSRIIVNEMKRAEDLEEKCIQKKIKSLEIEERNVRLKYIPLIATPVAIMLDLTISQMKTISPMSRPLVDIGASCLIASYYVTRANPLPPRKNCFSRGIDNFKVWYNQQSEPSGLPAPAFSRYYGLEQSL